ncbi:MAG TPA: cytochrome c oxidase accessory protein CcoG [Burkholderiaceae bacterium]|nr:cytochrome c oxidase accessory protein CcoG [Burkholderiaceae bacterium]
MYEAHRKVYPRAVTGTFARLRTAAVVLTQLLFYGLPWLTWNGRQAVLFDLGARKFHLFGLVLWPQDFIYLAGLLVLAALALFFFTTVAGRLWCGYACPQTVYTELFMWIEHRIEGDRGARMKLDASPWSVRKLRTKAAKHAAWAALALFTGFTFIGYFAPVRELAAQAAALELGPWQWFWMLFYAFATWGNAGFMREQVCTYMCPYARFQGAMFDEDTMIVGYDAGRGEPRGSRPRRTDPAAVGLGSCVDCTLCVQVCPTGIDIRQGLQYECIGCAACIDVCDSVMDKMGYARGLIRYSTQRAMAEGLDRAQVLRRVARPRVLVYGALLLALALGLAGSLAVRNPLKVDVIRDRHALARIVDAGDVENTFRLHLMNASERAQRLAVSVEGLDGIRIAGPLEFDVDAASNRAVAVSVQVPAGVGAPGSNPIRFVVRSRTDPSIARHEKAAFMVPR